MDDTEAERNTTAGAEEDEERSYEAIKPVINLHKSRRNRRGALTTTAFQKSNRKCLDVIREALLKHDWQEAANNFIFYIQTLQAATLSPVRSSASEITWRVGTEILHHLPSANLDDCNVFYEQLKNNGIKNYSKIGLEHCFHLLLNQQFDEAKRQLSITDCWKDNRAMAAQALIKTLIRGYCGYLFYLTWSQKRPSFRREKDWDNRELHSYFRQASVTLKEIINQPGVWDPFILSYVDMMEFYEDHEAALQVLENYAYNKEFPLNPNAHVYLYQFLKKHRASKSKRIGSLRVLHSLTPSHELMLELCSLLMSTDRKADRKEALTISMDLLEFSSWKCDLRAWNFLLTIIKSYKARKCMKTVRKEWKARKSLWLPLHFRNSIGRRESLQNVQLLLLKRDVLKLMREYSKDYLKIAREAQRGKARLKK